MTSHEPSRESPPAGHDAAALRVDEELPGEPAPPVPGARPGPHDDPTVGEGEREVREAVLRSVADAPFPATRNDLLRHIGTDDRGAVQGHLRTLPPTLVFHGPEEVADAFGGQGSA